MGTVDKDQLTHVLALGRALTNNGAQVLEEMSLEELVELLGWTLDVLVELAGEALAEDERIGERAVVGLRVAQQHEQESVEGGQFVC